MLASTAPSHDRGTCHPVEDVFARSATASPGWCMPRCTTPPMFVGGISIRVSLEAADAYVLGAAARRLSDATVDVQAALERAVALPAEYRPAAVAPGWRWAPYRAAARPVVAPEAEDVPSDIAWAACYRSRAAADRARWAVAAESHDQARSAGFVAAAILAGDVVRQPGMEAPGWRNRFWAVLRGSPAASPGIYRRWISESGAPSALAALADTDGRIGDDAIYRGFATLAEARTYADAAELRLETFA